MLLFYVFYVMPFGIDLFYEGCRKMIKLYVFQLHRFIKSENTHC